jgi:hypothetical protein
MRFITPSTCILLLSFAINCVADDEKDSSLSFSFFGAGHESLYYQETSSDFANEAFTSEYEASAIVQTSGGFTQISPKWGLFIITASPLLENEEQEEWSFDGYGIVQKNKMSLTQNSLDIQISFMPFDHGQYFTGGLRYQKVAFTRFDFEGAGNIDGLNSAIINTLNNDPNSQYKILKTAIEAAIGAGTNTTGVLDSNGNQIKNDQGNLITTVDELNAAVSLNPALKKGVIFENASSFMASVGYGIDSYFKSQESGFRYRAGIQVGVPLYLSVLNTDNANAISETLPSGYDITAHLGAGYQFTKEVGVILQYQYLRSQRDEIRDGNIILPNNLFQSNTFLTQVFWAF